MKKGTVLETEVKDQEIIEKEATEAVDVKPYSFRKLGSSDVFIMFRIIGAIGVNNFTQCMESKTVIQLVKNMTEEEKGSDSGALAAMGAVVLEAANVIFSNIGKCENDIYKLLSQTAGISIEEITAEGNAVMFFEMLIDFLKKEEFPDFIKAVSKLFK